MVCRADGVVTMMLAMVAKVAAKEDERRQGRRKVARKKEGWIEKGNVRGI